MNLFWILRSKRVSCVLSVSKIKRVTCWFWKSKNISTYRPTYIFYLHSFICYFPLWSFRAFFYRECERSGSGKRHNLSSQGPSLMPLIFWNYTYDWQAEENIGHLHRCSASFSLWRLSELMMQTARHESHVCCLFWAGRAGIQPAVGNTHDKGIEQLASSIFAFLWGLQLSRHI